MKLLELPVLKKPEENKITLSENLHPCRTPSDVICFDSIPNVK
jgi:hypothetical protein